MEMTEDLIRNVIQQVLSQMAPGSANGSNGSGQGKPSGKDGVYPTADAAVLAAEAAFKHYRKRPLACRRKAVACIRDICVSQAEELGRMELDETKIGRLDHKIAKLRDAIPRAPGVEYLRTDNWSGDDGITLTDYAPFGVIGAITPVTHSLPTLAGNAINMLASGNTVVVNAHPSGSKIAAEGVRRFNRAIRQAIGLDDLITIIETPTLDSAAALFDHKAVKPPGGDRRTRPWPAPRWRASGVRSSPGRATLRWWWMRRPTWSRRRSRSSRAPRSTTTCSASARSRSSPCPTSSTS